MHRIVFLFSELNEKAFNLFGHVDPEASVVKRPTDHEQADGTVLAMCITGTSSKVRGWVGRGENGLVVLLGKGDRGGGIGVGSGAGYGCDVTRYVYY